MGLLKAVMNFGKNRPLLHVVQIEPVEYSPNSLYKDGFIIHFYRRKSWTPWGFQKSINTSYILTRKHSFRVFQLLNKKAKFVSFHMHSNTNWIIEFVIDWYVGSHV